MVRGEGRGFIEMFALNLDKVEVLSICLMLFLHKCSNYFVKDCLENMGVAKKC